MKAKSPQSHLHLLIPLLCLLTVTNTQSQCHLKRFPQLIPMLYGQEATINLQQYVTGSNITFTVEPNDFFANIQPQYSCKWLWSHQLGRIIATQQYEIRQNNKTQQLVAMLGGSAYFTDVYLVYYGINVTDFQVSSQGQHRNMNNDQAATKESKNNKYSQQEQHFKTINFQSLNADNLQVLQVPRYKLKDCKNFNIISNTTHLQIILDCLSLSNPLNKILSTTIIPNTTPNPTVSWTHIQSPIYLPKQIIPKLQNIRSQTAVIDTFKNYRYLVRTVMSQYEDYIEVWRWSQYSKEIIGLYDTLYFVDQDNFFGDDVDIRMVQVVSNTILVLDLLNGLHVMRLNKLGQLIYKTNIEIQAFTTFHYDPKQQLLFMGKQGQIQQYQIQLYSQTNIKANRIQRYHLFDFQDITQITTQNRFLYVSTQKYIHVIHLTNIPTNDQDYDGSYKVYPELYVQKLIPTTSGFIRVIGYEANVQISVCDTHPPFLRLKTPKLTNNFTIHAVSTINERSTQCSMTVTSALVTAQDDKIYPNGYEAQNQTIFSNRPGTTIVDLQKYGIGKNIDYEVVTFNHQIPFTHNFRKTNPMGCEFVKNTSGFSEDSHQKEQSIASNIDATPLTKTSSVGNWLIVQYPQKRVKQYYKCSRYQKISCKFIHLSIVPTNSPISAYQLIEQERTKKEYLHEAMSYQLGNQTTIEVALISGTPKNLTTSSSVNSQQRQSRQSSENLSSSSLLCKIKYPAGAQFQISQFQLRQDKLYVVLPHMKQIRVYEALLSFQQDLKCHYLGSINVTSFKHPTIFFSPQHIDFNKQQLNIPYTVPSSSLSRTRNIRLTSQTVEEMFVSQWNQILVIRLTIGSSSVSRIEFLKSIIVDRLREASDASLIVTLPYVLAVDKQQKIIAQYYFTHTFDAYFIRMLDFWWDNSTTPISTNNNIRLVDSNTLAVMTPPDAQNQTHVQIYILNSIVSSFKDFAKWKLSNTFHVMAFTEDQYQFLTINVQQTTTSLQMYCNSTTLTPSPYLSIDVPKKTQIDQPSKEQFYLRLSTNQQSKRYVLGLQVASDSSDILKGDEYPYKTLRLKLQDDQDYMYVQLNDSKWFKGNIWNQRYVCNDCNTGRIRFEDKISLVSKIQLQSFNIPKDFYVHQRKQNDSLGLYSFETISGYLLTKLTPQSQNNTWLSEIMPQYPFASHTLSQNNITYTFSQSFILTSNTQKDPSCIKASPSEHDLYFASLCDDYQYLDDSAMLELKLYSNTGFKPVIISEYFIQLNMFKSSLYRVKAGTKASKQLIIISPPNDEQNLSSKYDTLFVRFDDNIWVFLVINGKLELIYTVDKVDFGGDHLCWMEVVAKTVNVNVTKTQLQYGIFASMCETGLYYIVFTVDPPKFGLTTQKQPIPSFHRISQQHIDLQTQLQKNKIQLPQHSYFLQTIIKPITAQPRSYFLYTIVQNFNSFIWKITILRQTIAISGMQLVGVIRRYNEYSPIQVTSNDDRYFTVLYKSIQNANVSEFLAVYDNMHYVLNKEKDIREYNMFSVQVTNKEPVYENKSEVFQIGTSLFLLNKNQVELLNVTNLIRMHIQKRFPEQMKVLGNSNGEASKQTEEGFASKLQLLTQSHLLSQEQEAILYSQSIIIFVQTPTQVNSVTIKLDSIDFFELSGWQITFIVFGSLIALIILYYISKELWKYIQKRRKLVRLQTDLIDDKSSSKVSSERHSLQDKQNDIRSDNSQEQQQQPRRNIHNRDTLITTSDSHSILQRKPIEQSLLSGEQE